MALYILAMPTLVLVGGALTAGDHVPGRRLGRSTPGRTGCPRSSTPTRRRATTTAARSPVSARTPTTRTPPWAWRCCSAGSSRSSWCSAWPVRWRSSAACPRAREPCPPHGPVFVGLLLAVVVIIVAPDLHARPCPVPDCGGPAMSSTTAVKEPSAGSGTIGQPVPPDTAGRRPARRAAQAGPGAPVALPGDVRGLGRVHRHHRCWPSRTPACSASGSPSGCGSPSVRQPRRGRGRGPRAGAGRQPSKAARTDTMARRLLPDGTRGGRPGAQLRVGRPRGRRGRRDHPRRRRRRRGRGQRGRVGDHRRVRAGDPRVRRRPLAR